MRFFLQEFAIRNPDLKINQLVQMNSEKEMYIHVVGVLEKSKTVHGEPSLTSKKYEFLANLFKSCILKGGPPPEFAEFRIKAAPLAQSQRTKFFEKAILSASRW